VPDDGLCFDRPVPTGGYVWWYIDALSDDGSQGITLIAFVGSVFSPYYAWARRTGTPDPVNHCALNVALYGPRAGRWTMTERGAAQVERARDHLVLGRSALDWMGGVMHIDIDEICAPVPRRLRGSIQLTPAAIGARSYVLDAAGRHRWTPFAPCAHVEVRLSEPDIQWSGVGYMDSNVGEEPVEHGFREWTWSRASLPGSAVVLYDVTPRTAPPHSLALRFAANGSAERVEPPPEVVLPMTGWRIARRTRADSGHGARVVKTLEDAPFYSRSQLATRLLGCAAPAVHESLDLNRFRSRWVQCLLPFRMPRSLF
jgi:carotenoid 1,2-hydratase